MPSSSPARISTGRMHLGRPVAVAAGSIAVALGVAVLVGWYTRSTLLIQVVPAFAPMQYNAALAFLLCGTGLLALIGGWLRLATGCGLSAAVLGMLTFIEYVFSVSLGIDQLFFQPFLIVHPTSPGRMPPNSALSFALTGTALIVLCVSSRREKVWLLAELLGAAVLVVGLVATVGYLAGLPMASRWGYFAGMAVHTAVGVTGLGMGILAAAWAQHRPAASSPSPWLPMLVGIGMAVLAVYCWRALITHEHILMHRTVSAAIGKVQTALEQQLTAHFLPLVRMARRWEMQGQPPRDAWEAEATMHILRDPGLHTMAWANAAGEVQWVVPDTITAVLQARPLGSTERQLRALELAQRRATMTMTRTLELTEGGPGFHVYIPIIQSIGVGGMLVGVFRVPPLLDNLVKDLAPGFAITVFDGDEAIYSRAVTEQPLRDTWGQTATVTLPGVTWHVHLAPTREFLAAEFSVLPDMVLIFGLVVALLLASMLALAQASRQRARQLATHLQHLEAVRTVSVEMTRELDLAALLDLMLRRAVDLVPAAGSGVVYLWNEAAEVLVPHAWYNRGTWMHTVRLRLGEGLVGMVAQQQHGLMVNDYQASPYAHPSFVVHLEATAIIAEPLLYRERLVGVMTVDNHATTRDFAEHDRALLMLFAAQAAIAVANAQLFAEVHSRSAILEQTNKALQSEIRERRHAEAALQASAQFLQLILDALPAHIAILDDAGTLVAVNAAWRQFAEANGFTGTAYGIGVKYLEVCDAVSGDASASAQAVATGIREVLTQQRAAFSYEYSCHSPSEQRWFLLRVAPFASPDGLRVVVVHENVTELKQAEAQLQRQQEALLQREKLAAMGSLLASVAHELNNPLSVVMMQADLLREEATDQTLEEQATAISQAAERCMHIVHNFLALARQSPPQRLPVQLNTVVGEALQLLAYTLRLDNIAISQHLAEDLPLLWADPHQLQQVVINLLTNAHHALREASMPGQLTIITRFDPVQAQVRLEVADTGSGMPPEVQARIFEPFFTTKAPGTGTGLGLSLCQGIIESHGGTISVESRAGRGTVFYVTLPVEVTPVAVADTPPAEAMTPIDGQARAILVVDDEAGIVRALAYLLRRDGYQVDTAANGRLALAKLQEGSYDLVLCDLRMPELDGPSLYRALEACAPHLLSRFIFLTGDTLSPQAETFLQQTGVPHLMKPFRSTEVRQVVRRGLDASQTG